MMMLLSLMLTASPEYTFDSADRPRLVTVDTCRAVQAEMEAHHERVFHDGFSPYRILVMGMMLGALSAALAFLVFVLWVGRLLA